MRKLICSECKKEVTTLVSRKGKGGLVCKTCKATSQFGVKKSYIGIDCFPADGIFLEHVSPEGHRFMSKGEMREWEKRTGTMIGCLH